MKIRDNGILFITSENVQRGYLLLDKPKFVEKRFNEIEKRSVLQKGDILTNIVGASIGRTAIYNSDDRANINQAVCIIRPIINLADRTFLMHLFNTDWFIGRLLGERVENARANVSMGSIKKIQIPLPSLSEQEEIVKSIDLEKNLIQSNYQLIDIYSAKINDMIAKVWGE